MERYDYLPHRVVSSREWQCIPIFLPGKFHGQSRWAIVHGMCWSQRARCDWTCMSLGLLGKVKYNNLCEVLDISSLAWWIFIECLLYARCSCISRSSGQSGRPHPGGSLPTFNTTPSPPHWVRFQWTRQRVSNQPHHGDAHCHATAGTEKCCVQK